MWMRNLVDIPLRPELQMIGANGEPVAEHSAHTAWGKRYLTRQWRDWRIHPAVVVPDGTR